MKGDEMANESSTDVIKRYLEGAIAAERGFEVQLRAFSKEGDQAAVQNLFAGHADETKHQYERLTARLEALGGSSSTMQGLFAYIFNFTPKAAHLGHHAAEKSSQDLIAAYAMENSEMAMYEELAIIAGFAGDTETESLARAIQQEERVAAEKVWGLIDASCRQAFMRITSNPANVQSGP